MSSRKNINPKTSDSQMSDAKRRKPKNRAEDGAAPAKILAFRQAKIYEEDRSEQLPAFVNYHSMPFHHLIPASLLASDSSFLHEYSLPYQTSKSTTLKSFFLQSLIAYGYSAQEAALFDDSVECSFIELNGNHLFQIDWEALHYDAIAGCREFYLAEMFLCKERIYQAGDNFPKSLKFTSAEITEYLPKKMFSPFVENIEKQFLRSAAASYTLTVSLINFNRMMSGGRDIPQFFPDLLDSSLTKIASRTMSTTSDNLATNSKLKANYQIVPTDYWGVWQKAARSANFDFDFLRALNDARAVRFYELTKLRRVSPSKEIKNNRVDLRLHSQIPISDNRLPICNKLEIDYEQFVALMPLPRLSGAPEIKRQINQLIKPLRTAGYVKSFAIKHNEENVTTRRAKLIFRFND